MNKDITYALIHNAFNAVNIVNYDRYCIKYLKIKLNILQ